MRDLWDKIKGSNVPKTGLSKGREKRSRRNIYRENVYGLYTLVGLNHPTDPESSAKPKEDKFKGKQTELSHSPTAGNQR